jgi:Caspase domain
VHDATGELVQVDGIFGRCKRRGGFPGGTSVRAQQADATKFNQTYESAVAKAHEECHTLWADPAFDPIRDKIPLEGKPTFPMLKNSERLHRKDRPLADLAIKTLERCRAAYTPVYAMLPPQVYNVVQGLDRRQDALIVELYTGKITFGEYSIQFDRMLAELAGALSGIKQLPQTTSPPATSDKKSAASGEAVTLSHSSQPTELNPASKTTVSNEIRVALVIGDGGYLNLPKLVNPENDARAIADLLKKMGFSTRLVLNASEQDLRREVRKFAGESNKADIAVVFYAGHGAQVNGENYVLPVDIDIPRTESDIQLTGLKVDDLVNSIRAKTKVVFLDACRDNPVLFKNLVNGRGASPTGLAPAIASNLTPTNPGGGVFIAYETDAGSVALEGEGNHSPFTQALLRNLTKPISIDDMFSLVTKEVRLVTKNAQRPYKYASLENIVCLTGGCSAAPSFADTDVVQEAKHSEAEDLQIALQTKNSEALEAYLQKYLESPKRGEISSELSRLKRSDYNEWTLFEVANSHLPFYIKVSSVEQTEDKVAILTKSAVDPSVPNQQFPDAAYVDELAVYDCKQPIVAFAERTVISKSGKTLSHYKWADPQFLNLAVGTAVAPGTINSSVRNMLCHEELQTPLLGKKELSTRSFTSLSSTVDGSGDVFYAPIQSGMNASNEKLIKDIMIVFKMHKDTKYNFPPGISVADFPEYRTEVDRVLLKCDENKVSMLKSDFYDVSNNLIVMIASDLSKETKWDTVLENSPFALLQSIVCKPNEAQQ